MSVIIDIDHETGDLSQYTSYVDDSGDLSVTETAALAGSTYGLSCLIDDTNNIYGEYNLVTPNTSGVVRVRFYYDPNGISIPNYNKFAICNLYSSVANDLVAIYDGNEGGDYLRLVAWADTGYTVIASTSYTDEPHYIEFLYQRASSSSASDGVGQLWIDGSSIGSRSDLDNYDMFDDFDYIRLGAVKDIPASTDGTIYLDELVVNDDGSEIGPVADGDLTVSESDAVTLGESIAVDISDPQVTESDGVSVGESATARLDDLVVSESDDTTLGESSSVALSDPEISASDDTPVGESSTVAISDLQIIESDNVITGEDPTVSVSEAELITVSVSDAVSLGESSSVTVSDLFISSSDDTVIGESSTITVSDLLISQSDEVTLGETVTVSIGDLEFSASDGVTLGETDNLTISDPQIAELDNITVDESVTVSLSAAGEIDISESDAITLGESQTVIISSSVISASDNISLGESSNVAVETPVADLSINISPDNYSVWKVGVRIYG